MHGGVGLCSCRHLVDEVCEGPVVPVTLVVNITEFEVARARGFGGLALERGEGAFLHHARQQDGARRRARKPQGVGT